MQLTHRRRQYFDGIGTDIPAEKLFEFGDHAARPEILRLQQATQALEQGRTTST